MPDESQEEPEQGEDDNEPSLLVRLDEAIAQINLVSLARHFASLKDVY
jgi:cleavage and polyadenylation specificity factor subunit 3